MSSSFLKIKQVSARYLHNIVFQELNFKVRHGEHWALVGESGSGKSSLLKVIQGQMSVSKGKIEYGFYADFLKRHPKQNAFFTVKDLMAEVAQKHSFRNLSNTTQFYYQQRYHAADADDAPTLAAYLASVEPTVETEAGWSSQRVIETFQLQHLLDKQLIKLSNGETKRLLLAAALLKNPRLLLLDQPLTGLDVQTRTDFSLLISDIIASGITVIMATAPQEIPEGITHVAVLEKGQIVSAQPVSAFQPNHWVPALSNGLSAEGLGNVLALRSMDSFHTILQLKDVSVQYGEKQVLTKVNWHVRQGERWALLGPNGAGKTTLLSLLNGDNPQAFSKDITLFDRKRGTGETIWDIKKKIGFVSPELFQFFPYQNTCGQVVESGLYDTLGLFKDSQPENAALALRWLELLGIGTEAGKPFKSVSASTQRLCLLARALLKNPPLLILDEPCQGMDAQGQARFQFLLNAICAQSGSTLIYVTHYPAEIPACVTKVLRLEKGEVVTAGD